MQGVVSSKGASVAWYGITYGDKNVTLSAPVLPKYNNYANSFCAGLRMCYEHFRWAWRSGLPRDDRNTIIKSFQGIGM